MVQPASAAVTSASSRARLVALPGASGPPVPGVAAAAAVTRRRLPLWYGAANCTGTSAVRVPPGARPVTRTGSGVLTPGPSTRTSTGTRGSVIAPGPSLTSVTRIICRGR